MVVKCSCATGCSTVVVINQLSGTPIDRYCSSDKGNEKTQKTQEDNKINDDESFNP